MACADVWIELTAKEYTVSAATHEAFVPLIIRLL